MIIDNENTKILTATFGHNLFNITPILPDNGIAKLYA